MNKKPRVGRKVRIQIGSKLYSKGNIVEVNRFFALVKTEAGFTTTIHRSEWPSMEYVK